MSNLLFFSGNGFGIPLLTADIKLWLDASDTSTITSSGGDVSNLSDKSGGEFDAAQLTGSAQPKTGIQTINGRNALTFANGDFLASPTTFSTSGYTVFMVMQLSVAVAAMDSSFPRFFRSGDTAQSHFLRKSNGRMEVKSTGTGGTDNRPNYEWETNFATNETVIIQHDVGLSNIKLYGNNVLLDDDDRVTPMTSLSVGTDIEIMRDMQGAFGELIVYDRILTQSEIAQVYTYLNNKWNGFKALTDIEGLQALYDTTNDDYLTLDGTAITQFLDQSGRGNDTPVQGTASNRPTRALNQINGLQAATFDGGDTLRLPTSFNNAMLNTNYSVFMVYRTSNSGTNQRPFVITSSSPGDGNIGVLDDGNNANRVAISHNSNSATISGFDNTQFFIGEFIRNGTTITATVNGGEATATETNAGITDFTAISRTDIGGDSGAFAFLTGSIAYIAVFDRALNSTEIDNVNTLLSNKFNIELA